MERADLLACWRSGQIEASRMVELCREDPALDAEIRESDAGVHVEVKS